MDSEHTERTELTQRMDKIFEYTRLGKDNIESTTRISTSDSFDFSSKTNKDKNNELRDGTIFSSSVNLINANVGIGTVGLAFGILNSGWILAIIFFIIFHFINHFTVFVMMEIGSTMNIASYAIVCSQCKVEWLYIISEYCLVIELLLSCTSYLIIIGDFMSLIFSKLFENSIDILHDRRFWILIYLIFLIVPTTIIRKINSMQYASFVVLLCFVYFIFIVFIYIDDNNLENDNIIYNKWPNNSNPLEFFKTMSLFVMAYGGHVIVFAQTSELKQPTTNRMSKIVWIFSTFSTFIFCSVGFGGYFTFGDKTMDNILLNYPDSFISINILRITLCIALSFSYSILTNTIKNSLASIIFGIGIKNDKYSLYKLIYLNFFYKKSCDYNFEYQQKIKRENQTINNIETYKFYILIAFIITVTLSISLLTNNLGFLFQLNGATAAAFNQIIFPGLIYIYAFRNIHQLREQKYSKFKYFVSIIIAGFGIFLVPFMVYFAIDTVLE